ncbi:2-amino-4-hydroxy-6-hydroxymethyldihydropteridine diphosphokinase [Glutamicibacter creatinolyticus]|uniref:2-amino-4-hydroxy-6- hydroxymethyldihydropteridine diphosphokinase n=1 Tax=Glutamicibacter creatinolyticus TaxID=162496 RepID=UPI0033E11D16
MDRISVTGITATGHHGVFEHEKREGQPFTVDVVLHTDTTRAALSDNVTDTVHYGEVSELVVGQIQAGPWDLIEKLAEQIAQAILTGYPSVARVDVTVHKPQAPIPVPFDDVTVAISRVQREHRAVLALGSNLGESRQTLQAAVRELQDHPQVRVEAVSPLALTKPVGGPGGQPDYLNQVIAVRTTLDPHRLLDLCQQVEREHHRTRTVRWEARTLDVDVITYDQLVLQDERLTLPHPRAHLRGFVLAPWSWMDPDAVLGGQLVSRLAAQAEDTPGIIRL